MPSRPLSTFPGLRTNDAMAGLLARRSVLRAAFPEHESSSGKLAFSSWLTVAGTASDFHRLPFWPRLRGTICVVFLIQVRNLSMGKIAQHRERLFGLGVAYSLMDDVTRRAQARIGAAMPLSLKPVARELLARPMSRKRMVIA